MFAPILLVAILLLLVWYLIGAARYSRFRQYADLPQFKPSLVWGHMKVMHEYSQRIGERHSDDAFKLMSEDLGRPSVLFVDLRPAFYPTCVITSHEVAEQIARQSKLFPQSVTKSPSMHLLTPLIGPESLITKEGEEWKALRRRFNPGFAPQHLSTLLSCILDKTDQFLHRLDDFTRTGEEFRLDELCIGLTFDIIGAVTMDFDFDAQLDIAGQSPFIKLYSDLVDSYTKMPIQQRVSWLSPRLFLKRRSLSRQADRLLKSLIRTKFAEQRAQGATYKSRSVISLSLQDTDELTPELLDSTCDQLKSFLFAGHDTTSILLQWVFYELSCAPRIRAAVCAELDAVLGPDSSPAATRAALLARGEELASRLRYLSAVIKEALRLHPPGGSARMAMPGSGFTVRLPESGEDVRLDGLVLYICHSIIHRDRAVYGADADVFRPERWLDDVDTSVRSGRGRAVGAGGLPGTAWRPFERGPRNCIGQELANLEARVILASTVRRYNFEKVGLGESVKDEKGIPLLGADGRHKIVSELYNINQVTSKPADGMLVRVRLAVGASEQLL